MYRSISFKCQSFLHYAICLILTVSLTSCSKGAEQQSIGAPSASGGISFSLVWQRPLSFRAKSQFTPSFNACVDYGVDTLTATVYDGANNPLKSDSWPCTAHQGVIAELPAGSNYTVKVDGTAFGLTTWQGQATGITVTTGQITDAGTIVLSDIGPDTVQPTVTSIAPASNPSITTNVPVTDRIIIAFSERMAVSTVNTTNVALINSSDASTVSGIVTYVTAGNSASFTPSANLAYDTQYVLQVASGIADIASNLLASEYTNTFTTESAPAAVPSAPSGVAAKSGNGQVALDWSAVNGAAFYNVYYGLSSGVTATNGTKLADARAPFIHMGLTNTQTYYYIVTAENFTFGESQASAEINATPLVDSLAPGLAAYYPFNGNASDASGNANNGTVSGATLTTDRFGYQSSAYSFDGSTSSISLGNLGAIDDYSVSLWFKKGTASGYPAAGEADLFGTQTSIDPQQYFKFGFNASYQDNLIVSLATTSLDYRIYTTPAVTDTNWHHLVVTRSGILPEAYLDGVKQALTSVSSAGTPSGTITSGNETKLGTVGGISDSVFSGVLDDARVYRRTLSADEITRLFLAANPNVLSPPASLAATPGTGQNVIDWPAVAGATSYNLYWSTTPVTDKTTVDHVIFDVASPYTHSGLTSGQTLYYIIAVMNSFGESTESMQIAATPF